MSTPVIHPERAAAYARGDLAERMTGVACELACLVRDEDAGAVGAFLSALTPAEKDALLVVAAAMIPVDGATPSELLAWVTWDEFGAPLDGSRPAARFYADCGTAVAYWRHRRAGHPQAQLEACGCGQVGRDYYVARYASRRGGQAAARVPKSRMEERAGRYAELRRQGDTVRLAAEKLGVSERTASRYEAMGRSRAAA